MKKRILLMLLTIVLQPALRADYSIERLEPPFWWAGMKNGTLMLMVYGPGISDLSASLEYPEVALKETIRVENPNYLFLMLEISPRAEAGQFTLIFRKGDNFMLDYSYVLKEREPGSAERFGFTGADVIYLITPDRFANGNTHNDVVAGYGDTLNRSDPKARHGGDIAGVSGHLDYIREMGFTAIWLNPVLENAMARTSYHGYAITDYYQVDPRFGTLEEYRELGLKCRQYGIKLIMDMVMNHCGSNHWWMKDLPSPDWIHFGGNFVETNHRRTTIQDPYAPASEKKLFSDGWFVSAMPDLNQRNPLLAAYLIQNSIWWIEYAHLQGIRHDTHCYPDPTFMAAWSCSILEEYPDFNIVGEEWSPNPAIISYWQRRKVNPDGYISCMPSMMDFPMQINLVKALNEPEAWNQGFIHLYENLASDFLYPDPNNLVIFPDNHDMSRFYTQVNEDFDLFRMGIAYILTIRGIPQIYYGTEVLMANPGTDAHGVIRSDFPGGWADDPSSAFHGTGLNENQSAAREYMRKLINWRKNKSVIHNGNLIHYSPLNGVYVYFRQLADETVMIVMNKNKASANIDTSRFGEVTGDRKRGTDPVTSKIYELSNLQIPPKTALILELD